MVDAVSGGAGGSGGSGGTGGPGDVLAGVPMALYVQDAHPIREAMGFVQRAEALGFAAVWQADSRLVREATVPMAAFAATTERIAVGSGVIDVWTRNPARLASLFSTLDDLAPGRVRAERVVVDGEVVVDGGVCTRVDAERIRARAWEEARRLWSML